MMVERSLEGRRAAVLAEDQYEDLELWYPLLRLREAGARVEVIGVGKDTYTSKYGYPVDVDAHITDVRADDYDGLVIPGGFAPDKLRRYESVLQFVRDFHEAGKLIAFICHAGWVPISAQILRGRRVTSTPAIRDDLVNAGAEWWDEAVVRDGHLVTSRRPPDLPDFAAEIIATLQQQGQ